MKLYNKSKNLLLADQIEVASSLPEMFFGLMGKPKLMPGHGLLIKNCRSVHSHFMKFSLDIVFLSKEGVVKKILWNFKPWRISLPVLSAYQVVELGHGDLTPDKVALGDQLYVEA